MAPHSHRRQVILFLAAVLVPCVALVALGLRLVVQERELASSRLEDERRRVANQLQQELSSHLERIALRQATALLARPELSKDWRYDDSVVVLIARASEGRLLLPWEENATAGESRRLLRQGDYGERVGQGERAEFGSENPARAIDSYRLAMEAARYPVQEVYARHLLARALTKAGRAREAESEYLQIAVAPPEVVDENGIPISLYAARQLLKAGLADTVIADCLKRAHSYERWPTPPAIYLLRDLTDSFVEHTTDEDLRADAESLAQQISREIARTERTLALRENYPNLGLIPIEANPTPTRARWIPYGTPPWLVGNAPMGDQDESAVVAMLAEPILAALEAGSASVSSMVGEVSLAMGPAPSGGPLGPDFPGISVSFLPVAGESSTDLGSIRWWFYSVGLLLVIGVTLFGAYLLWRDIRREVQLADTRSRFVSAVSHELKTPLTAIRMFAETLHESEKVEPDTQSEYLQTIVNESERLTRLLNNVLDFSKIEDGKKDYHREFQPLEEIVRFTAQAMRYPLEQKRFALRLEIEEGVPPARVDKDAIEQAILNLLANAMKYSGESRNIELRLRSQNGEAVIEVADKGVGIDPTEVPHIFERYYRVSSPENDHVPGTGLGLTLVWHIAQAHDGRMEVESVPGEGSTFSLYIPLNGAEA